MTDYLGSNRRLWNACTPRHMMLDTFGHSSWPKNVPESSWIVVARRHEAV